MMEFPRTRVRRLVLCLLLTTAALPAAAQDVPRAEVSGGYQFLNVSVEGEGESLGKGWYADVVGNLNRTVGIVFEVGGSYKSISASETFLDVTGTATVDLRVHEFMGGVRFNARPNAQLVPFGQVLVGAVNGSAKISGSASIGGTTIFSTSEEESATNLGLQVGGGLNFLLTERVGVRVGVDYLRVFEEDAGANLFRFAAGIVIPFSTR